MRRISLVVVLALLALVGALATATSAPPLAAEATIRLLASDRAGITLELAVPEVVVEAATLDGRRYDRISLPGFAPGAEPGQPDLPRKVVLLGVPPGAELQLSAEVLEVETLPGAFRVAPVPRFEVREDGPVQWLEPVYEASGAAYGAGDPYPARLVRLVGTGYVRSQRVATLELAPVQYQPASGELRLIRRLRVQVTLDYPDAATQALGTAHAEERTFEAILAHTLLNYEAARSWRAASTDSPSTLGTPAPSSASVWTPPQPAWKVLVDRTGLYRLAYGDLEAAGLPVGPAGLDPRSLKLYNAGVEVALYVGGGEDGQFDGGDVVEFYGQGLDSLYTGTNVYWLTYGGADGQRMATRDGTPGGAPLPGPFTATTRIEENRTYVQTAPDEEHWFWESMAAQAGTHTVTEPLTATFSGMVGVVAPGVPSCTVGISLVGATYNQVVNPDHHALVYLNDHLVADLKWDGQTSYDVEVEVPQAYLASLTNTFRVDMPADTGAVFDTIHVDGFTVECGYAHRAVDGELAFGQEVGGTWSYRASGFDTAEVLALDVTDPASPVRISGGLTVEDYRLFLPLVVRGQGQSGAPSPPSGAGGPYSLVFQDAVSGAAEYLVLAADRARTPLALLPDLPSNLADGGNQAEYVMVAHDELYTRTLPLAAYWTGQGLSATVVRVSDVYDEFSYGVLDPAAIRDFLAYAYQNWQAPRPAYVLLVGDATYDPRDYRGYGPLASIPAYLLPSPFIGETGSDNWYASVSGDDYLPDLHLGRLPAGDAAEAERMVDKILSYAQSPPPGTWNEEVLFVADNADSAGDFAYYSDVVADNYLPPAYTAHKVYYKITHMSAAEATAALTGTINSGTLLVNYVGHGSPYNWAHEKILWCYGDRCDFDDLHNGGKLPFIVSMTCMDGYYIHPDPALTSLAERWLLKEGGGGIAAFAATGDGTAAGHDWMNRSLFTGIFSDTLALGPATTGSKLYLHSQTGDSYRDLVETYHLFGDPALSLNLP